MKAKIEFLYTVGGRYKGVMYRNTIWYDEEPKTIGEWIRWILMDRK
jgi:L-amino acid N-acyltransferase YncA